MQGVNDPRPRADRRANRWPMQDVLSQCFDVEGRCLVVRIVERGSPSYIEDGAAAKYTRQVDTGGADADPVSGGAGFDFRPFNGAVVYWRNNAATHTSVELTFWAYNDLGHWTVIDTQTVGPNVEAYVPAVGNRPLFVQVTATGGGAAGTIDIYAAGV